MIKSDACERRGKDHDRSSESSIVFLPVFEEEEKPRNAGSESDAFYTAEEDAEEESKTM